MLGDGILKAYINGILKVFFLFQKILNSKSKWKYSVSMSFSNETNSFQNHFFLNEFLSLIFLIQRMWCSQRAQLTKPGSKDGRSNYGNFKEAILHLSKMATDERSNNEANARDAVEVPKDLCPLIFGCNFSQVSSCDGYAVLEYTWKICETKLLTMFWWQPVYKSTHWDSILCFPWTIFALKSVIK